MAVLPVTSERPQDCALAMHSVVPSSWCRPQRCTQASLLAPLQGPPAQWLPITLESYTGVKVKKKITGRSCGDAGHFTLARSISAL